TELLGTHGLDRGDILMASLYYQRLLERQPADQVAPLTLFKAALAFRLSGDPAFAKTQETVWKQLAAKVSRDGLRVEDDNVGWARPGKDLNGARVAPAADVSDWLVSRGNASRSARGRGGAPFLDKKWETSLLSSQADSLANRWTRQALEGPRIEPAFPA